MNINQQYISERNSYSGQIPRYIVIHNTDNYSTDADAKGSCNGTVSWEF